MIAFLILYSMLGIKPAPIDDDIFKDFPVSEFLDETTTDCTENPSSGGPTDQTLKIELVEPLMPDDTGIIPLDNHSSIPKENKIGIIPLVMVSKPEPNPAPEPQPPKLPDAITPEPPVAILAMTVAILFLILFGYRKPRKLR